MFDKEVYATGEGSEWAHEEKKGYDGAVFGFEAVDKGNQGDGIKEEVEEVLVQKCERSQSVYCGLSVINSRIE